jgi:hypothetical protein
MSYNILLDNGTFNSKAYKSKSYSFDIPLEHHGYGTNIYMYRLECKNIPTTLCPADDTALVRKSLLAVKYVPSEEQLLALDYSNKNYAIIFENIVNASKYLESEGKIIESMDTANVIFNNSKYYSLKSERDILLNSVDNLMSIWKNGNHISTKSYMMDMNLVSASSGLLSEIMAYNSYLSTVVENHNSLLTELVSVHSTLQEYVKILSLNMFNIDSSTKKSLTNAITNGNSLISQFENGNYNYGMLYRYTSDFSDVTVNINKFVITNVSAELSRDLPSLYIYSHMLCISDSLSNSLNVSNSSNASKSHNIDFCKFDYALNISNISDASTKLTNVCDRASSILKVLEVNSSEIHSNSSKNKLSKDSVNVLLLQYKLLIDYESINDNTGQNAVLSYYSTYLRDSLKEVYNISDPETLLAGYVFNDVLIFDYHNLILLDIFNINTSCYAITPSLSSLTINYYSLPTLNLSNFTSISLEVPPQIVPQCCIYGKCQDCEKVPSQNPLILLHGHSFNQDTHAYQSIEIFNGFEQAFRNDKTYFPTGVLVKNSNSTVGILGHFYVPIVSKPTYYLETYNDLLGLIVSESKTGNIDTYALRLKESIDYTMYVTGSNKVDIVAHSMGGLVVRRYMQIFGTQNLGTIILIATPNKGITDKTYSLCKIFGALNECEDMRTDGLFVKKLNDYSNQPDMKNLYLVVGKGCDTDGLDGDGVVTINNSLLKIPDNNILYVDGTCNGANLLHNELLDVNKHPEVYEFVKEKLTK